MPRHKGELSAAVSEIIVVSDRIPSSKNTPKPWEYVGELMSLRFISKFFCCCGIWVQPLEAPVRGTMLVVQGCEGDGHAQSIVAHLPSVGIGELSRGCVRVRFSNEISYL